MMKIEKVKTDNTPTLVVVDGNNVVYRSWAAMSGAAFKNKRKGTGISNSGIMGTLGMFRTFNERLPLSRFRVVFTWDLGGSVFRKGVFGGYKRRRTQMNQDLKDEIEKVQELFSRLDVFQAIVYGVEADDIIGFITKTVQMNYPEFNVVIVSGDHDLYQLLAERVRQYVLRNHKQGGPFVYTEDAFQKEHEVRPIDWPKVKAIMGDDVDDIPGIRDIGPKTAIKLVKADPTLEGMLNQRKLLLSSMATTPLYKNPEVKEFLQRNFVLCRIRRRVKEFQYPGHRRNLRTIKKVLVALDQEYNKPDFKAINAYLTQLGIRKFNVRDAVSLFGLANKGRFFQVDDD